METTTKFGYVTLFENQFSPSKCKVLYDVIVEKVDGLFDYYNVTIIDYLGEEVHKATHSALHLSQVKGFVEKITEHLSQYVGGKVTLSVVDKCWNI